MWQKCFQNPRQPELVWVPTENIMIGNPDVLAMVRLDLMRALDRRRYGSKEMWARAVLASREPVDLYRQDDGSLLLLDGNHRFLAATILGQKLPAHII